MPKKYKYTKAQFRAFWVGRGYRAGQKNKRIPYQNQDTLNSFRAGYASAKSSVDKYPKLEKKHNNSSGKILKRNKNYTKKFKFGLSKKNFTKPKKKIQPYWHNDWGKYGIEQKKKPKKNENKPIFDFSQLFDFDEKGRIKGSYNSNGFFEPD